MLQNETVITQGCPGWLADMLVYRYVSDAPASFDSDKVLPMISTIQEWLDEKTKGGVILDPVDRSMSARDVGRVVLDQWINVIDCPKAYELLAYLVLCHDETCKPYTDEIVAYLTWTFKNLHANTLTRPTYVDEE